MRDILEWPPSERCLARDSASRACNLGKTAAAPATAAVDSERIGRGESMPPALANPADRFMTIRSLIAGLTQQEDLNFLLTNRIPRAAVTRFIGWFSKIEQPLVRDFSIACWRMFSDLDLSEARKTSFKSLHDCFTRELRPGLRPYDPDPSIVASPCDAIVGAFGAIADTELFQIKGAPYSLLDLLGDPALVDSAPQRALHHAAADLEHVPSFPCARGLPDRAGYVHPRRHLERQSDRAQTGRAAVLQERTRGAANPALKRRGADAGAGGRHSCRQHPAAFSRPHAQRAEQGAGAVSLRRPRVAKGDELGWFEHGSTIIVLTPDHFEFCEGISEGTRIRAGQALLRKPT